MRLTSGRKGSLIVWWCGRVLAAGAVVAGTGGVVWLTILFGGPLYILGFVVPAMLLHDLVPHASGIAFAVGYMALPLAGVIWWGWRWWARCVCLGMLLANVAFLMSPTQFAHLFLHN
jgi:hypothetical protein